MNDARVAGVLNDSAAIQSANRIVRVLHRAVLDSLAAREWQRCRSAWRDMTTGDQRRFIGVTLITAAIVSSLLMMWRHTPPGWMWIVMPLLMFATGIVCVIAGVDQGEASR